ncbi:type II toxin-antitoxin system RelE/ParE family toxin [Candidatus Sumerlaeota bacterium]|nr:type II toxin-antitoxin system RelE/ParE family toxin [Candidatus Sumerlaeota bacterium]
MPLICFRSASGSEPVREWLKRLSASERQAIGKDLRRAQWRWPVGMPHCRPMGKGLWEVRTDSPTNRSQIDRILDPKNDITLSSLQRAAAMVGRRVRIELV